MYLGGTQGLAQGFLNLMDVDLGVGQLLSTPAWLSTVSTGKGTLLSLNSSGIRKESLPSAGVRGAPECSSYWEPGGQKQTGPCEQGGLPGGG